MPLSQKNKKQESEELLNLRLTGSQIILHSRLNLRPPSRTSLRPMSATPTLFLQEKRRKTPAWMRPQSADFSRNPSHKKLAAKFHYPIVGKKKQLKGGHKLGETYTIGSVSNLLGSIPANDLVETDSSIGPSPEPGDIAPLCSVLEPGLIAKPPIPPTTNKTTNKIDQKSLDDIINIKFQRWFPESAPLSVPMYLGCQETEQKVMNIDANNYNSDDLSKSDVPLSGQLKKYGSESGVKPKVTEKDTSHLVLSKMPEIDECHEYVGGNNFSDKICDSRKIETCEGSCSSNMGVEKKSNACSGKVESLKDELNNFYPKNECTADNGTNKGIDAVADSNSPHSKAWKTNSLENEQNKLSEKQNVRENFKPDDKKAKKVTIVESSWDSKSFKAVRERKYLPKGSAETSDKIDKKSKLHSQDKSGLINNILQDDKMMGSLKFMDPELVSTINMDGNIRKNGVTVNRRNQVKEIDEFCLKTDDVRSWVESHSSLDNEIKDKDLGPGSTYNDIITMLEVLEKEEIDSVKLEDQLTCRSTSTTATTSGTPVGARDILTFLDGLDNTNGDQSNAVTKTLSPVQSEKQNSSLPTGRMATLLNSDSSDLAKHVMTLSLELEERNLAYEKLNQQVQEIKDKSIKQKKESDMIIKRHQKFIDQLLSEKRVLGEQCASAIKEMSTKHSKAIQLLEERHSIELKKQNEKMLAAEKIRREKWIDAKTKKIKELTVKGLEPELQRMTNIHQEELSELRRAHDRELSEMELACQRRLASAREQALRDRETAIAEERDAARKKLELEMSELERSYQEQRRKLLGEVRDERERMEKEVAISLEEKERKLEGKWQKANKELEIKLESMEEKYQAELKNMREIMEGERQLWLDRQVAALSEKEKTIREQCKKERDKHINMVLNKIDAEATEKEKSNEKKYMKLKEQYEAEIKEMETLQDELKKKLKDARSINQQNEDCINQLKLQISQLQGELSTSKQANVRMQSEWAEEKRIVNNEAMSQIAALQKELEDAKNKKEETLQLLQGEKQRELQQVYNRVIEAMSKKEEAIRCLQKQRDTALAQCTQLEQLLEKQRKNSASSK